MSKSGINKRGRSERTPGGYTGMDNYMLDCAAWKALSAYARCLYWALKRRHRSKRRDRRGNNGRIVMSRREAMKETGFSEKTIQKAFADLIAKGFVKLGRESVFQMKSTLAREWAVTEFPVGDKFPTKEFVDWAPEIQNTGVRVPPAWCQGATRQTDSPTQKAHSARFTGVRVPPVSTTHGCQGATTSISQGKERSDGGIDSKNNRELGGKCSLASKAKIKFDISSITYWPAAKGDDNENEFNGTCPKCWQQ